MNMTTLRKKFNTLNARWSYLMMHQRTYRRIPAGSVHYFNRNSLVSICGVITRDETPQWKIDYNYFKGTDANKFCSRCIELFESRNKFNEMIPQNGVLHYIHKQTCSKCGLVCAYFSKNPHHVDKKRVHIGCTA